MSEEQHKQQHKSNARERERASGKGKKPATTKTTSLKCYCLVSLKIVISSESGGREWEMQCDHWFEVFVLFVDFAVLLLLPFFGLRFGCTSSVPFRSFSFSMSFFAIFCFKLWLAWKHDAACWPLEISCVNTLKLICILVGRKLHGEYAISYSAFVVARRPIF